MSVMEVHQPLPALFSLSFQQGRPCKNGLYRVRLCFLRSQSTTIIPASMASWQTFPTVGLTQPAFQEEKEDDVQLPRASHLLPVCCW